MATVINDGHVCSGRGQGRCRGGVAWGAVIAGAVAAAVLTLLLIILGTGLGFAAMSPFANEGASAETLGMSTAIWITLISLLASAVGGYIAGRLRPRWHAIHTDEVYFRDTAHGFLAWALSTLLMATLLSSAVSGLIGGTAKVGAAAVGGAAAAGAGALAADKGPGGANAYLFDRVFRSGADPVAPPPVTSLDADGQPRVVARPPMATRGVNKEARAEAARIFVTAVAKDELPADDKAYLTRVVAREAGISEADASKRIDEAWAALVQAKQDAKEAADKAAKAAAYASLWMFIALLAGAFIATLMATRGGRCRDDHQLEDVVVTNPPRVHHVNPAIKE